LILGLNLDKPDAHPSPDRLWVTSPTAEKFALEFAATRLIATMLFGLSPSDLPTITGVSLLLFLVALFAGYLPARRASSIDPMVALRTE
jgi:ABC-type lipoprotein release transport system permease subunit